MRYKQREGSIDGYEIVNNQSRETRLHSSRLTVNDDKDQDTDVVHLRTFCTSHSAPKQHGSSNEIIKVLTLSINKISMAGA